MNISISEVSMLLTVSRLRSLLSDFADTANCNDPSVSVTAFNNFKFAFDVVMPVLEQETQRIIRREFVEAFSLVFDSESTEFESNIFDVISFEVTSTSDLTPFCVGQIVEATFSISDQCFVVSSPEQKGYLMTHLSSDTFTISFLQPAGVVVLKRL